MKLRKMAKKFGTVVVLASTSSFAFAADEAASIMGAVDLTTVAAWVGGVGVLVVGIKMAFKGIDLSKRAINKA